MNKLKLKQNGDQLNYTLKMVNEIVGKVLFTERKRVCEVIDDMFLSYAIKEDVKEALNKIDDEQRCNRCCR